MECKACNMDITALNNNTDDTLTRKANGINHESTRDRCNNISSVKDNNIIRRRDSNDFSSPARVSSQYKAAGRPPTDLITGGGGYVGHHIAQELLSRGHRVILFDIREPPSGQGTGYTKDRVTFVQGDIRSYSDVKKAFGIEQVDCVYHVVAYGMSGREQLYKERIRDINVNGTKNIIRACQERSVPSLIYTSTCNVVFSGDPIYDGDESLPYCKPDKYPDHYSRTKAEAEQEVLRANGSDLAQSDRKLRTVALRAAGIYGVGEERHFPRVAASLPKGHFLFQFGSREPKLDFIHIDNLVQVHVLAGEALSAHDELAVGAPHQSSGKAYFTCDGEPINTFDFMEPFITGLGFPTPIATLPYTFIISLAFICQLIHSIISPFYHFEPLLSPMEVYKMCVHHSFSIDRAKRELGYRPRKVNDISDIVAHYRKLGHAVPGGRGRLVDCTELMDQLKVVLFVCVTLVAAIALLPTYWM